MYGPSAYWYVRFRTYGDFREPALWSIKRAAEALLRAIQAALQRLSSRPYERALIDGVCVLFSVQQTMADDVTIQNVRIRRTFAIISHPRDGVNGEPLREFCGTQFSAVVIRPHGLQRAPSVRSS
jgi:hypothetical protein